MPRAKQRTPELRAHVLEVALSTLTSGGVVGFTTRKVADGASTSTKAVYELFGDKGGLVRDIFFEGFRLLGRQLEDIAPSPSARADLAAVLAAVRGFVHGHPVLSEVMFSRPFAHFDPGPDELVAGAAVRELIVERVQRHLDAQRLDHDATDIAHVLLAFVQGLATQESAGWLGRSTASIERRWDLAMNVALDGLGARGRAPTA